MRLRADKNTIWMIIGMCAMATILYFEQALQTTGFVRLICVVGEFVFGAVTVLGLHGLVRSDSVFLALDAQGYQLHGVWGPGHCMSWADVIGFKPVQFGPFGIVIVRKAGSRRWTDDPTIPAAYGLNARHMAKLLEHCRFKSQDRFSLNGLTPDVQAGDVDESSLPEGVSVDWKFGDGVCIKGSEVWRNGVCVLKYGDNVSRLNELFFPWDTPVTTGTPATLVDVTTEGSHREAFLVVDIDVDKITGFRLFHDPLEGLDPFASTVTRYHRTP